MAFQLYRNLNSEASGNDHGWQHSACWFSRLNVCPDVGAFCRRENEFQGLVPYEGNDQVDFTGGHGDWIKNICQGKPKRYRRHHCNWQQQLSKIFLSTIFSKYPHIIRKNRSSVAILDGKESSEDLKKLGNDVFDYFGLGCRNVFHDFLYLKVTTLPIYLITGPPLKVY